MNTKDFKDALRAGSHSWLGGYPLFFITEDGEALSFAAARENVKLILASMRRGYRDGWTVVRCEANWEDESLYCSHSGERIECAYPQD
jgi:hypothetical protein